MAIKQLSVSNELSKLINNIESKFDELDNKLLDNYLNLHDVDNKILEYIQAVDELHSNELDILFKYSDKFYYSIKLFKYFYLPMFLTLGIINLIAIAILLLK